MEPKGAPPMRESERVFDELLVLHAQAGDVRALRRLAARWQPRLLRSARLLTGDEEATREAVQESWVSIVAGMGRLRDPAAFPGWALTILRRRCAERIRFLVAARARGETRAEAAESSTQAGGEIGLIIAEAFDRLPEEQRIAATLYFVEQYKLDEIAAATDAPLGTVKSRIFAARKSLKMALEGEKDDTGR
jgi:RNA polymerase sigma factor (sigma-70 family)